jgi:hypothetical protein
MLKTFVLSCISLLIGSVIGWHGHMAFHVDYVAAQAPLIWNGLWEL